MTSGHLPGPSVSFPDSSAWVHPLSSVPSLFPVCFLPIVTAFHRVLVCLPVRESVRSVLLPFVPEGLSTCPELVDVKKNLLIEQMNIYV